MTCLKRLEKWNSSQMPNCDGSLLVGILATDHKRAGTVNQTRLVVVAGRDARCCGELFAERLVSHAQALRDRTGRTIVQLAQKFAGVFQPQGKHVAGENNVEPVSD